MKVPRDTGPSGDERMTFSLVNDRGDIKGQEIIQFVVAFSMTRAAILRTPSSHQRGLCVAGSGASQLYTVSQRSSSLSWTLSQSWEELLVLMGPQACPLTEAADGRAPRPGAEGWRLSHPERVLLSQAPHLLLCLFPVSLWSYFWLQTQQSAWSAGVKDTLVTGSVWPWHSGQSDSASPCPADIAPGKSTDLWPWPLLCPDLRPARLSHVEELLLPKTEEHLEEPQWAKAHGLLSLPCGSPGDGSNQVNKAGCNGQVPGWIAALQWWGGLVWGLASARKALGFCLGMDSPCTNLDGGCMGVPGSGYPQR